MIHVLTLEIIGQPIGQPKHGQVARPVPATKRPCGHYEQWQAYSHPVTSIKRADGTRIPHPIVAWRQTIFDTAKRAWRYFNPLIGPLRIYRCFRFRRLKSHFGTGRNAGVLKPGAPVHHTSKPDPDNVDKSLFDMLTQAGVITDDCIIAQGENIKRYCDIGESPGVTVRIWKL
jgi:crossover junction endodeoxyribonuclease RusA